jgi:hypothetical protein
MLNSKYILFQIIFALNKLNTNGDLILLLSGSNHIIYQQYITILSTLFDEILLINSEIDYSYRYFAICKRFKPNLQLINELTVNVSNNNDNILINSLDSSNHILDINFEKYLQIKFNKIISDISYIEQIFNNQQLIDKIYTNNYYYQLNNTYKWLNTIFKNSLINNELNNKINKFNNNIIIKIKNKKQFNSYLITKIDEYELNFLGENINSITFNQLINCIDYLQLFNIMNYHNSFINKSIDINSLINEYKLDHPLYIEDINKLILQNLKNQIIIKFELKSLCPFMLSIFYICLMIYDKVLIVESLYEYYFICIDLNKQELLDDIIKLYDLDITNINSNYQIVIINEDFLSQINSILNKLFIQQLINIIRLKSLSLLY